MFLQMHVFCLFFTKKNTENGIAVGVDSFRVQNMENCCVSFGHNSGLVALHTTKKRRKNVFFLRKKQAGSKSRVGTSILC